MVGAPGAIPGGSVTIFTSHGARPPLAPSNAEACGLCELSNKKGGPKWRYKSVNQLSQVSLGRLLTRMYWATKYRITSHATWTRPISTLPMICIHAPKVAMGSVLGRNFHTRYLRSNWLAIYRSSAPSGHTHPHQPAGISSFSLLQGVAAVGATAPWKAISARLCCGGSLHTGGDSLVPWLAGRQWGLLHARADKLEYLAWFQQIEAPRRGADAKHHTALSYTTVADQRLWWTGSGHPRGVQCAAADTDNRKWVESESKCWCWPPFVARWLCISAIVGTKGPTES